MKRVAAIYLVLAACEPRAAPPRPQPERFGLGRAATAAEIAALDDDMQPDGTGLPPGRGTVAAGASIYAARCASCHGSTGREGPFDVLVGGGEPLGFRVGRRPKAATPATIGNLYPHATTLYDYLHRTMPWPQPGSLAPDEVYSLVAWLLHENAIVPADAVLDATSLPSIEMPARRRFTEVAIKTTIKAAR
jgi:cytochrome c